MKANVYSVFVLSKTVQQFFDDADTKSITTRHGKKFYGTLIMHLAYLKPWKIKMRYIIKQYLYYHSLSPFKDIIIIPESYYKQY